MGHRSILWGRAEFYGAQSPFYGSENHPMNQRLVLWGRGYILWGRSELYGAELHPMVHN